MFPRRPPKWHHPFPLPGPMKPGQEVIIPEVFTVQHQHVKNHVFKHVPVYPKTYSEEYDQQVIHTNWPPHPQPHPPHPRRRPFF
ncbi:hypothetical protein [Geomicrobium sp. JCM 19055]|uniref:hypothetical protein n=1 Tax=Geomicrobium sp. JCM 19055 TaxID=1460649 RepID=UPI00045ECC46|nr:hypothetical protein [Geomicrobium sp. JCM 19055]GAJ98438.1 hypothetical protein JCM19055_1365 [Geomicrobium sp. JCM 19055]